MPDLREYVATVASLLVALVLILLAARFVPVAPQEGYETSPVVSTSAASNISTIPPSALSASPSVRGGSWFVRTAGIVEGVVAPSVERLWEGLRDIGVTVAEVAIAASGASEVSVGGLAGVGGELVQGFLCRASTRSTM